VRVTNNSDATVLDSSDVNFKIVGILQLTSPNGGERWTVATNHNVTWQKWGAISNVKLEYTLNNGASYSTIIGSTAAGALSSTWNVADDVSKTVKVRISDVSDSTVFDMSDAVFIIQAGFAIASPDGGEVWSVGSSHGVSWTT
jgi:hypothetical protein